LPALFLLFSYFLKEKTTKTTSKKLRKDAQVIDFIVRQFKQVRDLIARTLRRSKKMSDKKAGLLVK
jgi:hypothetical protein